MKTHKDTLRKNWYRGGLLIALSFVLAVALTFFFRDIRWLASCIVVVFVAEMLFPTKCPTCEKCIYIRPGTHALDNLNFCQSCGFNLNTSMKMEKESPNKILEGTGPNAPASATIAGRGDSVAAEVEHSVQRTMITIIPMLMVLLMSGCRDKVTFGGVGTEGIDWDRRQQMANEYIKGQTSAEVILVEVRTYSPTESLFLFQLSDSSPTSSTQRAVIVNSMTGAIREMK